MIHNIGRYVGMYIHTYTYTATQTTKPTTKRNQCQPKQIGRNGFFPMSCSNDWLTYFDGTTGKRNNSPSISCLKHRRQPRSAELQSPILPIELLLARGYLLCTKNKKIVKKLLGEKPRMNF